MTETNPKQFIQEGKVLVRGMGKDRGGTGLKYVWIYVGLGWHHRSAPWRNPHGHEVGTPLARQLEPPSWLGGITDWLSPQDHKERVG